MTAKSFRKTMLASLAELEATRGLTTSEQEARQVLQGVVAQTAQSLLEGKAVAISHEYRGDLFPEVGQAIAQVAKTHDVHARYQAGVHVFWAEEKK